MELFPVIDIPEELWLNVNYFNFDSLTYEDLRDIYNSPSHLIEDFQKIPDFNIRVEYLNKTKESRKIEIDKMKYEEELKQKELRELQSHRVAQKIRNSSRQPRPNTPRFNKSSNINFTEIINKLPPIKISEDKPPINKKNKKSLCNIFMRT